MSVIMISNIVLILVLPITYSANTQSPLCPMGFQHMNSSCYYIESMTRKSRNQAQITCESIGSRLVEITSVEEDEFIRSLALNESSTGNYWIGLDVKEKIFRWMDGSPLTFTYWDGDQVDGTDCIRMRYNSPVSGFRWNDRTCKYRERAICEGNLSDPVCLGVANNITFNRSCYIIPDGEFLRDEAKEYCEGLGAHLAYIESAEENSFVIGLMTGIEHCWIGLTRRKPGSNRYEYSWISGEPLDYSNFGNLGAGSECIQINNNNSYIHWTSKICKKSNGYICERQELPQRQRQQQFMAKKEDTVPIPDSIINDDKKETLTKCAVLCLSTEKCTSFAYHALDQKCIIANSSIGTASARNGFKHYISTT